MSIDRKHLEILLLRIDEALTQPATLCLIGSSAFILLGQSARQTDDLDVWANASQFRLADLREAANKAGLAFDPTDELPNSPYIQIIHPGLVQVPGWDPAKREWFGEPARELWTGKSLIVTAPPPPALVASKLVRGDDRDFEDCIWLMAIQGIEPNRVAEAIKALPKPARSKAKANLDILTLYAR